MWFDIIYEQPKCNIDTIYNVMQMQWLGREMREIEVTTLNRTGRVVAYFVPKIP